MNWAQWLDLCTASSQAVSFVTGVLVGGVFMMLWDMAFESLFRRYFS